MRSLRATTAAVAAALACALVVPGTGQADPGGRVLEGVPEADESFICFFDGMESVLYRTEVEYLDGFVRIITDADGAWVRGISRGVYDAVEFRLDEESQGSGAPDPVYVTGVQMINATLNEEGFIERAVLNVPQWDLYDSSGQLVDTGRSIAHVDETGTVRANYSGACTDFGTGRVD